MIQKTGFVEPSRGSGFNFLPMCVFVRAFVLASALSAFLFCSSASAVPPVAPVLTKVGMTISSTTQKGLMWQWEDKSDDEDLFALNLRVGSVGAFTPVNYVLNNAVFGTWYGSNRFLANVAEGATLQFQVVAVHATIVRDQATNQITDFTVTEMSAPSNTMSVIYHSSPEDGTLFPPTGVTAVPETSPLGATLLSDGKMRLSWTDNSSVEDGVEFFVRKTSDTAYPADSAFSLPFNITDFVLPTYAVQRGPNIYGLVPDVEYVMKMRAVQGGSSFSGFSNEVTFRMPKLKPPTNLVVTQVDETTLDLNWTDNSDNEHGYVVAIELGEPFGDYTWDSVGANVTTYRVRNLTPGNTATWKVIGAFSPGGGAEVISSGSPDFVAPAFPSNTVSFPMPMGGARNLTAVSTDDPAAGVTYVSLEWTESSSAETGIEILQRRSGTTDTFVQAKLLPSNATSAVLGLELLPGAVDLIVRTVAVGSDGAVLGEFKEVSNVNSNVVTVTTRDGFISATKLTGRAGQGLSHLLVTTNAASRLSWSVAGLPAGLTFDSGTGVISGTLGSPGFSELEATATFADGWIARAKIQLRVNPGFAAAPAASGAGTARSVGLGQGALGVSLDPVFRDDETELPMRIATTMGNIDVVLYPSVAPRTVANFLAYANAGDYNGVVFHRVSPDFVIQGGGYRVYNNTADTFETVPSRPVVLNEPGISNDKGTLAMAKGSAVNSATHDFFFNLKDNTDLNSKTGGFTVFGRLSKKNQGTGGIDAVVQSIANLHGKKYAVKLRDAATGGVTASFDPLSGLGDNEFWPLDAVTAPAEMDVSKLVKITSVTYLPKFTYTILTPPDAGMATASIVNNKLVLTGVAAGTSSLVVTATDVDGQAVNQTISVTVEAGLVHPAITTQPVETTVDLNAPTTLSVVATGTNLSYQWRKDGVDLSGETSATLSIASTQRADAGAYYVVVTNTAASVESDLVQLKVNAPPLIVTGIANASRNYGGTVDFTVGASGSGPLTYQWFKGTTSIPLATSATLRVSPVVLASEADYYVVVTNTHGSATSATAHLTVLSVDTDGDGLQDDQEDALGSDKTKVDSDGDGYSDAVEVALASNPALASSSPSTAYFVAERDAVSALNTVGMKRLLGGSYAVPGDALATTVPDQWLASTELTNAQFAAVLQYAVRTLNVAEVVTASGRSFVRYPKTTGSVVCYLADATASPPSCEVSLDASGRSFVVTAALAASPVRAVSWYGAYLASVVLNASHGYADKCVPATFSYDDTKAGYSLPTQAAWGWAARGGAAALAYPTGKTVPTATQAKFGDTSPTAKPRSVGSYAASALGFFDLAGNVAEWMFEGDATNGKVRGGAYADAASALANATVSVTRAKTDLNAGTGFRLALKEDAAPTLVTSPQARFVRTGQPITLTVEGKGTPPLAYQWYKNDKPLTGKVASTLSIPSAVLADGGAYKVKVSIGNGVSVTSSAAAVAVVNVPAPVTTAVVAPNKKARFSVSVQGAPGQTFSYVWTRPLTALVNDYTAHGVDKPVLDIISAQQGMTDTYTCAVSIVGQPLFAPIHAAYRLVVYDLPLITAPPSKRLPFGVVTGSFSYQPVFDTSAERAVTKWSATGLPAGFTINPVTGLITGKSTVALAANVRITASNAFGSTTESMALVVRGLPPRMLGNFVATVARDPVNNNLGGRLDLAAASTGAVTGSLTLGGTKYPLKGTLAATVNADGIVGQTGQVTFGIVRKGLPTLPLVVTLDAANDALHATLTVPAVTGAAPAPARTVLISGWRAVEVISMRLGDHTVAFAPPVTSIDPALVPQGYSFATIKVTVTGASTVVGQLADGTAFSSAGWVGPEQILAYASLYGGRGSVMGPLRITGDTAHTIRIAPGEHLTWNKDDLGAASTERSYKRGFGPLELSVVSGGRYRAPTTGQLLMGLPDTTTPPVTIADNARLSFASGGLPLAFTQDLRITPTATAVFPSGNDQLVTLTPTASSGLFKGTFKLNDGSNRVVNFFGAMVPDPVTAGRGRGYGYFTLPQLPDATKGPLYSGTVGLGAAP